MKNLSSTDKENFVNAVLKLKKSKSKFHHDDPKFSRYDDYVEIHMHSMMVGSATDPRTDPDWYPGWAHTGPAFFPWHRKYLLDFEKDLQSISKDNSIFIPFWDWSDDTSSPFTPDFMGTDGESSDDGSGKVLDGPFAFDGPDNWKIVVKDQSTDPDFLARGFGRRADAVNLPTSVQIDRIMQIPFYDSPVWKLGSPGFRTVVEVSLHNLVHRWVEGTMITMCSPNDPVFWLHHANVDRLWGNWQRIHPTIFPYLPAKGAHKGHNLFDIMIFSVNMHHDAQEDEHHINHEVSNPTRVIDCLNHLLLGYRYDSDPMGEIKLLEEKMEVSKKISKEKHILNPFPTMEEII